MAEEVQVKEDDKVTEDGARRQTFLTTYCRTMISSAISLEIKTKGVPSPYTHR